VAFSDFFSSKWDKSESNGVYLVWELKSRLGLSGQPFYKPKELSLGGCFPADTSPFQDIIPADF